MTGQTPDISEWLDFDSYDNVWWTDKNNPSKTNNNIILGQCLGISHKIGTKMCYWVVMVSGKVFSQTTVQHVIYIDLVDPEMKVRIDKSDE